MVHERNTASPDTTVTTQAEQAFLVSLGWSDFFASQVEPDEAGLLPRRIAEVHRTRLSIMSENGPERLVIDIQTNTADFAVGDWVLADPKTMAFHRRLDRKTLLQRRTEGRKTHQLGAANVDTLFIVTSCNADFNPARLERYLALANQSETNPVLLLTKVDLADDVNVYIREAQSLQRDLPVVALNARLADAAEALAPWCGTGQTVALIGSSGVGKSTLVNTLAGLEHATQQQTGGIRESDAKGRHTTTGRSMHPIVSGGWVIDTPGMRTLHVSDSAEGIDTLFAEITDLAPSCKFRDCTHAHEPGCAVQAAVKAGTLPVERLERWRKLQDENRSNTPQLTGPRGNKVIQKKRFGK
ncbi:MAG TPA: ribosome small subunit-dependent GTPase A [Pararhizobium sp.]|nr:ribosome small subunit-dependent GTPase A [Pararhizobium sp.]HTO32322.1 ribosome small subunit-dependent GTPase A [Pararhizobium sp.]